ncbi:MAG: hypothetical protein ACJ8F7_07105, partial [Gemmataceae bacterium]
ALGWLPLTAALWSTDATRMAEFLAVPDGETRLAVAQLVVNHLSRDPAVRRVLTERLLPVLQQPGDHEAIGLVLREVLAAEVAALLSVADLTTLLARGAAAAKAAAAAALAVKPGALAELGLERVAALALHEVAAVRTAALILVRSAIDQLRDDPALLFVLAESEWPDTREVALNLIRTEIDLPKFGLDGFMGLIDSNRPDVQNHGRDLILRHLDELPILDLLDRLIQHPHANVRHFALDLVVKHLPEEPEALEQALPFCRAILFDMTPSRAAKRRVLEFLRDRGLRDAKQAALAAGLLGEAVRFRTRVDFEQALSGLARLQLAFPGEKKS